MTFGYEAYDRLLHLGNIVIDIVLDVPELPVRGGDMLATRSETTPGGGYNVMVAAARQGLPVAYGGAHGTGAFGDLARTALVTAGIGILQPPKTGLDTGFSISVVDAGGERTFLTSTGAEATLTAEDLRAVRATHRDIVYLSGYGLVHTANQRALADWLKRLSEDVMVVVDPGPLVHLIPADIMDQVLARADWWSCNANEATRITGHYDPRAAAFALASRTGRRGVLVRTGPDGCLLVRCGSTPLHVPGFEVRPVDMNGAGDAHTGVFMAALARDADPADAARTANAAAALAVTQRGPATAPTAAGLTSFLTERVSGTSA